MRFWHVLPCWLIAGIKAQALSFEVGVGGGFCSPSGTLDAVTRGTGQWVDLPDLGVGVPPSNRGTYLAGAPGTAMRQDGALGQLSLALARTWGSFKAAFEAFYEHSRVEKKFTVQSPPATTIREGFYGHGAGTFFARFSTPHNFGIRLRLGRSFKSGLCPYGFAGVKLSQWLFEGRFPEISKTSSVKSFFLVGIGLEKAFNRSCNFFFELAYTGSRRSLLCKTNFFIRASGYGLPLLPGGQHTLRHVEFILPTTVRINLSTVSLVAGIRF